MQAIARRTAGAFEIAQNGRRVVVWFDVGNGEFQFDVVQPREFAPTRRQ